MLKLENGGVSIQTVADKKKIRSLFNTFMREVSDGEQYEFVLKIEKVKKEGGESAD